MQNIQREQWLKLDIISRWLVATRASVFIMTVFSCLVGALLAFRDGYWNGPLLAACLLGLILAHATNNLLNDLTDYLKGVDKDNYFRNRYGTHPLENGLLSMKKYVVYIVITGLMAACVGIWIVWQTDIRTLYWMLAGGFFVLFYTWPLKYIGLGEISVIIVWGPLMVGGTYFVLSGGQWSQSMLVYALLWALGPTSVIMGKHTDKLNQDREKKIRTIPVLIGERAARLTIPLMWGLQIILLIGLVISGSFHPVLLVGLASIFYMKQPIQVYLKPRPKSAPDSFPAGIWPLYFVAYAFRVTRITGLIFISALILEIVVRNNFI